MRMRFPGEMFYECGFVGKHMRANSYSPLRYPLEIHVFLGK